MQIQSCFRNKSFSEKKLKFWETERKCPWHLTRIPNFIPIGRWERSEKSGEPKTGEVLGPPRGGREFDLKTEKNVHGQSCEEHVYQILTKLDDGKGLKIREKPKKGEKKREG